MREKWIMYIESLEQAGEKMTEEKWREWIQKESRDYEEPITEDDITYIIGELEADGFVL